MAKQIVMQESFVDFTERRTAELKEEYAAKGKEVEDSRILRRVSEDYLREFVKNEDNVAFVEPIADVLIEESQRDHISFDAFFANTMFHEVAHGLGIKNTIDGHGTVRAAMLDMASSMEEGKADILGLYMITELHKAGELGDVDLRDYYVTFMTSVFRSIRFGASSAHGKANMVRFNFFLDSGAFVRDAETGRYSVNFERMEAAMTDLSRLLLTLQGDGDYEGAVKLAESRGIIEPQLQGDLDRLTEANIPVDITLQQGVAELGIE